MQAIHHASFKGGLFAALVLLLAVGGRQAAAERTPRVGDFYIEDATIPVDEIRSGGVPKDGIPSIDNPKFIAADEADYLEPDDTIVGLAIDGDARAYPLRILAHHEIVNDTVGGQPVAVTYCPLCGTAMTFSRAYDGKTLSFGVSGLLHHSDVLMYDRQTESLWSQLGLQAVAGDYSGTELEWLPSEQMKWKAWRSKHPDTRALSTDTGHRRSYSRNPYAGYHKSSGTMFPVPENRDELEPKNWVAGVIVDGQAKAYPLDDFPAGASRDEVAGRAIKLTWTPEQDRFAAETAEGEALPVVRAYWFAWQAFYPETKLWENPNA